MNNQISPGWANVMEHEMPSQGPPIWKVSDLPALLAGDGLAFKADPGFQEWAIGLEHALTWHWAMAGLPLPADDFGGPDYQIIGSISPKGVATELLSAYQHPHMRIYRPNLPDGYQACLYASVLKQAAYYGAYEYNNLGVGESALAYFLKYLGIKLRLPVNHRFYCLQFYCQIWADFDFPLYDKDHPVTPYDLENTDQLQLIWGTF